MATFPISGSFDLDQLITALQIRFDTRYMPLPPVVTPPSTTAGVFWVYHNGQFNWPGDYSFNATIDYKDITNILITGTFDIAVTPTSKWGAWQPFAFNGQSPSNLPGANGSTGVPFDTTPYKYLIYSIKPTAVGQVIATGFDANNDVPDGNVVIVTGPGITKYGPEPQPGVWGEYRVPLSDFNFTNPLILKFTVADGSGSAARFYVDNVGFSN